MADETIAPVAPTMADALKSVDARLTALEVAVASLGAHNITQAHDGFAKFREWLAAFVARVT